MKEAEYGRLITLNKYTLSRSSGRMPRGSALAIGLVLFTLQMNAAVDCTTVEKTVDSTTFFGHGWGLNHLNHRFQDESKTSINASNVESLKLNWVYRLSSETPRSFPVVTNDTVYIGDGPAGLVALDFETGCEKWRFSGDGDFGNAVVHGVIDDRVILVIATRQNGVYAVDAANGEQIWHTKIDIEPTPLYSGAALVVDDLVFVPMSSYEIGLALSMLHGCCQTRGGMAALNARTGELVWYRPTIEEKAKKVGSFWLFVGKYAPSGATVWGAPTYDRETNTLLFGTGQNYTLPASKTSDAIFAIDATTGDVKWVSQRTANDAYNLACDVGPWHPNCPDPPGPDWDFGAPPVVATTVSGRRLVFAGQKSSELHALDPATGDVVWTTRLGRGGLLGGVHFGVAVNPELNLVYVPISDRYTDPRLAGIEAKPGLHALDMDSGDVVWAAVREPECKALSCWPGLSAAITATPELVFAAGLDGTLLAYSAESGELLWSTNTDRELWAPINGGAAHGGSYDAHGIMVAGDKIFVSSGYASFGQRGGNAFLAFELQGE